MKRYMKFNEFYQMKYENEINENAVISMINDILKTQLSRYDYRRNKIKYNRIELEKMKFDKLKNIWQELNKSYFNTRTA